MQSPPPPEQRRGRKRERTPSPESDGEPEFREIVEEIESHGSWASCLRSQFLFEIGIFEDFEWVKAVWESRPLGSSNENKKVE